MSVQNAFATAANEADNARIVADAKALIALAEDDAARAANDAAQSAQFAAQRALDAAQLQDAEREAALTAQTATQSVYGFAGELDKLNQISRDAAEATREQANAEKLQQQLRAQGRQAGETPIPSFSTYAGGSEVLRMLRAAGLTEQSAAFQAVLRQQKALLYTAALQYVAQNGVQDLPEWVKAVFAANGTPITGPSGTSGISGVVDNLRALGETTSGVTRQMANGFADVYEGVQKLIVGAGDAKDTISALTQVLQGAAQISDALQSGDIFSAVRGVASGAASLIGGPAVGGLVDAAFGFIKSIGQAVSDLFTGDSPAARAIRQGLTPAITDAFTQGILAAVQKTEGWQKDLRDSVKLVFLQSLIQAFVQGAIIQTYLQPIIDQYSKLLARGQTEAAAEYLSTALPGALDAAIGAAENFANSLPRSLIPSPGNTSGAAGNTPASSASSIYDVPTSGITIVAAPAWSQDMGVHVQNFGKHVNTFGQWAERLLANQGTTGTGNGGAGLATIRGSA